MRSGQRWNLPGVLAVPVGAVITSGRMRQRIRRRASVRLPVFARRLERQQLSEHKVLPDVAEVREVAIHHRHASSVEVPAREKSLRARFN